MAPSALNRVNYPTYSLALGIADPISPTNTIIRMAVGTVAVEATSNRTFNTKGENAHCKSNKLYAKPTAIETVALEAAGNQKYIKKH